MLDERKATALLDAGLNAININVGDHDEDYEEIYKLPFEKTLRERRALQRDGRRRLQDIDRARRLPPRPGAHRGDGAVLEERTASKHFVFFDIMNRGGALFVDDMQFEASPQLAAGQDAARRQGRPRGVRRAVRLPLRRLRRQLLPVLLGLEEGGPARHRLRHVVHGVVAAKMEHVMTREPICKTCNWDPLNLLADELPGGQAGESDLDKADALADQLIGLSRTLNDADPELARPSGARRHQEADTRHRRLSKSWRQLPPSRSATSCRANS